jgi:hypothetical protein
LATSGFCYLEQYFMEPGVYLDAPLTNSLYNFCCSKCLHCINKCDKRILFLIQMYCV